MDKPRPNALENAKMEEFVFQENVDAERDLKEITVNTEKVYHLDSYGIYSYFWEWL